MRAFTPIQDEIIGIFFKILSTALDVRKIAIRLRDDGDRIPFYKWIGHDDEEMRTINEQESEMTLESDEIFCLCQSVLGKGKNEIAKYCQPNGAFYSNDLQKHTAEIMSDGAKLQEICRMKGVESLGLIPFESEDGVIKGLFHLAESRKDVFSPEKISRIDDIARSFIEMLMKVDPRNPRTDKHVLIAEDDEEMAFLLKRILTRGGFSCVSVANGREALRHLSDNRIDLLITDINVPEMNGTDLIRTVRNRFGVYGPRIAVLSAMEIDPEFVREYGISVFLSKPLMNFLELPGIVEDILSSEAGLPQLDGDYFRTKI